MGFAKGSSHPTRPLILPDRQITSCFPKLSVQPLLQKYFVWRLTQITSLICTVLSHRGAFRDRHGRWERDAVDLAALGLLRDARQAVKTCEQSKRVPVEKCWRGRR